MTKDEALKLALEYVELVPDDRYNAEHIDREALVTAIKEALAQPEQEPVAWMNDMGTHIDLNVSGRGTPLYTTPPQRTWVGLTDEEIQYCVELKNPEAIAEEVEAKLKEKNT